MTLTWHRPGPYTAAACFTHYHDARGRLRLAFLYRSGERVLIRTMDHSLKLLKEEKRESLKAAKKLVEKRARKGAPCSRSSSGPCLAAARASCRLLRRHLLAQPGQRGGPHAPP